MNRLIILGAAALGGLLFYRRKSLKEDSAKLTSTAKEQAANVTQRFSGAAEAADDAELADSDTDTDSETDTPDEAPESSEQAPDGGS